MGNQAIRKIFKAIKSPKKAYNHLDKIEPLSLFTGKKLTHDDLVNFGDNFLTNGTALIIHSEIDCSQLFNEFEELPDHYMEYDKYLTELKQIPDNKYKQVVAMGVLEHLSDPFEFIKQCHRILEDNGRLYISASSVFSIHNGPQNYYHVTHYGMKKMLENQDWEDIEIRGSCPPFKTIGILLQRILLQCHTKFYIRPFIALLAYIIPFFDRFITTQYNHASFEMGSEIDSMMPSNIQLVAQK